jgi:hypothetical protein
VNNLTLKEKLHPYLLALLGSETLIILWWKGQNKVFSYKTPEEMLDINPDSVVQYIHKHSYGEW